MAGESSEWVTWSSLVEKAQYTFDAKKAEELQEKIADQSLNLEDFLSQLQQLKKLGPLENLLGMLPGMGKMPDLSGGESQLKRGRGGHPVDDTHRAAPSRDFECGPTHAHRDGERHERR